MADQLKKWPFTSGYTDEHGDRISGSELDDRLDCYAGVLIKFGNKRDVAEFASNGSHQRYDDIRIRNRNKFEDQADDCFHAHLSGQNAPPYPTGR